LIEHFQTRDDHSPLDFNRKNMNERNKSISKINTPLNPTRNSRLSTPGYNKSQTKINLKNNRSANSLLLEDYSPSILGKKSVRNHSTFDVVTTASDPDFNCHMKQ